MDKLPKVFVTSVIDPLVFWARLGCDEELQAEETLEDMISDYVSGLGGHDGVKDVELSPNQIILAKSNEHGGRWLRATAVLCSPSRVLSDIDVVFTGYGSTELVGRRDIITSVPDYVCDWTKSAECFRLDGVEPTDDVWSADAIEYFSHCVLKKHLPCQRIATTSYNVSSRLVIYASDDKNETIRDCLVRKGFAKLSADGGTVVTPDKRNGYLSASVVAATGGIPEFDACDLFFRSESPPLPAKETTSRDFEMELHKRMIDTSAVSLPTHSDDLYCGRRSVESLGSKLYPKNVKDIKEELAQVSKADRQLVRPEGWRGASGRPRSSRLTADSRLSSKSSKMVNNDEDDWRMPKESLPAVPPGNQIGKREKFEPGSFKKALCKHLRQNSTPDVVLAFLQPILEEGFVQ